MAVSDLTGTTWTFKDSGITLMNAFYTNFTAVTSANRQITQGMYLNVASFSYYYNGGYTAVYNAEDLWYSSYLDFKTITYISGSDLTNADFISWVETNAVQQIESEPNMYVGTKKITDMYVGNKRVLKVYVGDKKCYEYQAPTPSGFTVSGTNDVDVYGDSITRYSTDDGVTWLDIPTGNFTLPAMTTFKLKIGGKADYLTSATSTQLGLNFPLSESTEHISDNYTLTQNITDLTIHGEWD